MNELDLFDLDGEDFEPACGVCLTPLPPCGRQWVMVTAQETFASPEALKREDFQGGYCSREHASKAAEDFVGLLDCIRGRSDGAVNTCAKCGGEIAAERPHFALLMLDVEGAPDMLSLHEVQRVARLCDRCHPVDLPRPPWARDA